MATLIQNPSIDHSFLNMLNPQYSSPSPGQSSKSAPKPHNACDECRTRKLKCSGEANGCSRCRADRVPCRYSPRKQMGRPRKKRNEEEYQPAYEPWPAQSNAGPLGPQLANSSTLPIYHDVNSSIQQPMNGYPPSINSPGMNIGAGNPNFSYLNPMDAPTNMPAADLLPDIDLSGIDFSTINLSNSPNPSHDFYSHHRAHSSSYSSTGSSYPSPSLHSPTPPNAVSTPPSTASPSSSRNNSGGPSTCTCQPQLYRALQALPKYTTNPTFPQVLPPLKRATALARTLLACPTCPATYASALQNAMGSVTLLNLIIVTYHRLLSHIDTRAKSASKLKFRFGEMTPGMEGHTGGGLDCPMGVEVDLSGPEWRMLARKAVVRELLGEDGEDGEELASGGQGGLMEVLKGLRARQAEWHGSGRFSGDVSHQHHHQHQRGSGRESGSSKRGSGGGEKENCICVQGLYVEQLIRQVKAMDL